MGDAKDAKDRVDEVVARVKGAVTKEVEQHANEDVDLGDLEDVSGGWHITYSTDPKPKVDESLG
ncbi:MAG: hypothetical protein ACJ76N_25820 [Thermoanaerobaculia bacterium]